MKKRIISLLIASAMLLTMVPSYAEENNPQTDLVTETELEVPETEEREPGIPETEEADVVIPETEAVESIVETDAETVVSESETEEASAEDPSLMSQYIPAPVANLKAFPAGRNKVRLTWSPVHSASGYLIYGKHGANGQYHYIGTAFSSIFTDTGAYAGDYNFYWVFPYSTDAYGKKYPGNCLKYVYAKGVCPAVTNVRAYPEMFAVRLTWGASAEAQGYLIYGINEDGPYHYVGMTSGTSFTDSHASLGDWNFYWVYPYYKNPNGQMVTGIPCAYVYGKPLEYVLLEGGYSADYYRSVVRYNLPKMSISATNGYPFYAYGDDMTIGVNWNASYPNKYVEIFNSGNKRVIMHGVWVGMSYAKARSILLSQNYSQSGYTFYSGAGFTFTLYVHNGVVTGYRDVTAPTS